MTTARCLLAHSLLALGLLTPTLSCAQDVKTPAEWVERGLKRLKQQDQKGALEDFNAAIKVDPAHAGAYFQRGSLLARQREWTKAEADLTQAIKLGGSKLDRQAYAKRGTIRSRLRNYAGAIKDLSASLDLGDSPTVRFSRAKVYHRQRKWKQALADYGEAIRLRPTRAIYYAGRGLTHQLRRAYGEALADFNQALSLDPRLARALQGRADNQQRMGDLQEALRSYDALIKIHPRHAQGYGNRGSAKHALGRLQDAIADFRKAAELAPNQLPIHINLGRALRQDADYQGAVEIFTRVLAVKKIARVFKSRALAYMDLGKLADAIQDLCESLELRPDHVVTLGSRARAYALAGRKKQALADLARARKLDPKSVELALWHFALVDDDRILLPFKDLDGWDGLRVRHCLGTLSKEELLVAGRHRGDESEAHLLLGLVADQHAQLAPAARHYAACKGASQVATLEHRWASNRLRALTKRLAKPTPPAKPKPDPEVREF